MNFYERSYTANHFATLTQQEVLDALAGKGIKITKQTLRNWERQELILPPARGSAYGGRWTKYSEYVLAECYAAHMLLNAQPKNNEKTIPRFPIDMLADARNFCKFFLQDIPPMPEFIEKYKISEKFPAISVRRDGIIKSLPVSTWNSYVPDIANIYEKFFSYKPQLTYEELLEASFRMSCELLWFKYFCEGAKAFWGSKS